MQESDRGGEKAGIQVEPEDDHEQGCQGEVQVLAEVLSSRCFLLGQGGKITITLVCCRKLNNKTTICENIYFTDKVLKT